MRKNCETCKHDDAEYPSYPHKTPCNECLHGKGYNDAPTNWEAADHYKPDTNAERIRAMSDEELARFLEEASWICDNQVCRKCPLSTGTEDCKSVEEWLKQPVPEEAEG